MAMDGDDRQESDLELYRSRQGGGCSINMGSGTLGKRSTLARKGIPPPPAMLGKSPPRPSPASVAYHSDEESLKGYDENPDDSSVTEKPSEISSTDSQVHLLLNYKTGSFLIEQGIRSYADYLEILPTAILFS